MAWCGTKKAKKLLALDPASVLVFDLETTGVSLKYAEILQISLTDGNGCVLFTSYVKPRHRKSWPRAEKINHISPAMVVNAPYFDEIRSRVQDLFNQAILIVGYNAKSFDIPIIERYGIVVPQNRFDVMEEFRLFTGRTINYKLKHCAEYFHFSYNPHDATEDTVTTASCMQALIRQDGFVNNNTARSKRESKKADMPSPEEKPPKRPLKGRLLSPVLKKRQIPLVFKGILVMALSFLWICYKTYGNAFFQNIKIIKLQSLIEIGMSSHEGIAVGLLFLVGGLCCVLGIIRAAIKLARWVKNMFRKILKRFE